MGRTSIVSRPITMPQCVNDYADIKIASVSTLWAVMYSNIFFGNMKRRVCCFDLISIGSHLYL